MAYYTAATLRAAVAALGDSARYPDQVLTDLIAEFEEIAEDYRGVAYEPRTAVETHTTPLTVASIRLRHIRVRSITSITVDGTTVDSGSYTYTDFGTVESRVGFRASGLFAVGTAVVMYSHGYDSPPQRVLRACREYVRSCAAAGNSNVPRDIIATSADGMTTRYSTPDKRAGRPTGYIDVDRLLNSMPDERMAFA